MKRLFKKREKVTKGMPSAVVLSILIHAALFLLAGMLVVFTVVKKEDKKFTPPKAVERPKMKLKKPKVKIKKTSKPKPTTRIVTKVNRANMPDIQLPEMSGMGEGFGGGIGGFDLMPDLSDPTMYGASQSIGNDFTGTFYDSKRTRNGKVLSNVDTSAVAWRDQIHKFLVRGWDLSVFARYYRAPKKLYATNLIVPVARSSMAPTAFGDETSVGALWMVHYKGQLVHKEGVTFRFWGAADEFMAVRVGGELVMCAAWDDASRRYDYKVRASLFGSLWESASADSWKYRIGNTSLEVGDWITLEPGVPMDMEILIGDNGGSASFYLAVEEKGVEYERNRQGAPTLPAFKTAELSHDLLDIIYKRMYAGEICLTNGPVFCDYDISGKAEATNPDPEMAEPSGVEDPGTNEVRTWTLADGRTMEAEFINIFGGKVVLKGGDGKIHKIPKERLSSGDVEYAELASPPAFDVNFLKNFRTVAFSGGFYDVRGWERPSEEWGHFGVQLKQSSTGDYSHELQVEMFVVGKQWRRSKFILLDRQKTTFIPSGQEQRIFEFRSKRKVIVALDEFKEEVFGEKYYGYLVVVTDARGEMIAVESSHKWLPKILENLKKLSVGNFMDETCTRTYPDPPPRTKYY
ncbi:MAG: hypothetical protein DRP64_04545 [Verrucomicrobia bacterium]|nr:MAG: hypothetical protein DRP64_04545 [Verrucomicrobiota bacterium]